jgi:hypothetical protein
LLFAEAINKSPQFFRVLISGTLRFILSSPWIAFLWPALHHWATDTERVLYSPVARKFAVPTRRCARFEESSDGS